MSEQTAESTQNDDTEETSADTPKTDAYPAHGADNGEEQKNRLGYMVTEPTEEEIEGDKAEES